MDLQLHNSKEKIAVSDAVFGFDYKESLIHVLALRLQKIAQL